MSRIRSVWRGGGAVAALAAIAVGLFAMPAHAAQNIDPGAEGSITIHKFAEPTSPTDKPHNGTEVDTTGLTPLEGVTFTVQRVTDIDLTKDDDWQKLEGLTVASVQSDHALGAATSVTTDAAGVAKASDLAVGLYLVTETSVGPNKVVKKSDPFLVTIPLALSANEWIYDVHAYPKNTTTDITKEVDDSKAFRLDDVVTWTVRTEVPSLPAATPLEDFRIVDTFDSRLGYRTARVTVAGLDVKDGTDYVIEESGQTVTVRFTAAGRERLRTVQGAAVTVEFDTAVESIGDGVITNTATSYVNDPKNEKGFTSNTVQTEWGALKLVKYAKNPDDDVLVLRGDGSDESKRLQGAQFEIYALDGNGARIDTNGDGTVDAADALVDVSDGDKVFTTDDAGEFLVSLKTGEYEVVEVTAPLGYKLDSTPHRVTVSTGDLDHPVTLDVPNTQIPPFELPLTGGLGAGLFVGAGVLLAAIAVAVAVRTARRRPAEADAMQKHSS
jgi:fimbrial isopeptide formation D2 family protein